MYLVSHTYAVLKAIEEAKLRSRTEFDIEVGHGISQHICQRIWWRMASGPPGALPVQMYAIMEASLSALLCCPRTSNEQLATHTIAHQRCVLCKLQAVVTFSHLRCSFAKC